MGLLDLFSKASGLKVSVQKPNLLPINIPEGDIQSLCSILKYQIGTFLFTYLGVPLSCTKPKMESFMYIIERIHKRLHNRSPFLSYDGRLLIVNALSSLPTFVMSFLHFYKGIIDQVDKYRRHCFWRSKD